MRHLTKWKGDSSITLIGHKVSFPAPILPFFRSLSPIHPPVHPQDAARVVLPQGPSSDDVVPPAERPAVSACHSECKSRWPCSPPRLHLLSSPSDLTSCCLQQPHFTLTPAHPRAPALDLCTPFLSQPFNFLRGRAQMSPFLDLILQDIPACLRFSVGPITLWCGVYFTYSLITILFSRSKMQAP